MDICVLEFVMYVSKVVCIFYVNLRVMENVCFVGILLKLYVL